MGTTVLQLEAKGPLEALESTSAEEARKDSSLEISDGAPGAGAVLQPPELLDGKFLLSPVCVFLSQPVETLLEAWREKVKYKNPRLL